MDFAKLSNEELANHGAAWFKEVEKRFEEAGLPRALQHVQNAHALCTRAGHGAKGEGLVTTFSGDDKDGPPTGP
jgi:hypothetical protein